MVQGFYNQCSQVYCGPGRPRMYTAVGRVPDLHALDRLVTEKEALQPPGGLFLDLGKDVLVPGQHR